MKAPVAVAVGCFLLFLAWFFRPTQASQDSFILECKSVFTADADEESLIDRFGAENVTAEPFHLGEGEYEDGTAIFTKKPAQRVEVRWEDPKSKRGIRVARIQGGASRWRTSAGVTLGMSLRELEALNRFPFRLFGFGWDYGGRVRSWGRGTLGKPDSGSCNIGASLVPGAGDGALDRQVLGEWEFSSGHPAMQEINPTVIAVLVSPAGR